MLDERAYIVTEEELAALVMPKVAAQLRDIAQQLEEADGELHCALELKKESQHHYRLALDWMRFHPRKKYDPLALEEADIWTLVEKWVQSILGDEWELSLEFPEYPASSLDVKVTATREVDEKQADKGE